VFQTIGLKGNRDNDSILDRTGLVLSDEARITTRMRKINENTLEAKLVIEDPKALTKPWNVTKQFRKNSKPGLFRIARENSGWGYDRIVGALANLAYLAEWVLR
jgi:hypothetical protein